MLKVRIMPTLLYKDLGLVKGVGFDSWRRVGGLMQAVKVYNMRGVDELVFLDITATAEGRHPDFDLVDDFADECFMPLTIGGGVKSIDDVKNLLRVGADKVAINSAAIETPEIVTEVARRFGSQCVVASVDYRTHEDGTREVYTHAGTKPTGIDPVAHAVEMQRLGAGEILLTPIERDGSMTGYDLPVLAAVAAAVSVPVIASGGAGTYEDMLAALVEGRASALAAASIFHYTERTPLEAKRFLAGNGIETRV